MVKLANHFSLSIDALRSNPEENSEVVVCTTLPPIKEYADIDFYLDNTRKNLELAIQQPHASFTSPLRKFHFTGIWINPG